MKKHWIIIHILFLYFSSGSIAWGQELKENRDYQYALIDAVKYKNIGNLAEALKLYGMVIKDKPDY